MINYFIIKFIPITFSFSNLIYILKLYDCSKHYFKTLFNLWHLKIIKKLKKRNKIKMNKI